MKNIKTKNRRYRLIKRWIRKRYNYCAFNVWKDQRSLWYVSLIKIINLSVRSYLSNSIQSRARALTYNTLLAIVPAMAIIFSIARAFGLQYLIKGELEDIFPSQTIMIENASVIVDKYLSSGSGGLFVGIGVVFLLWTLIILLRNIEKTFNYVWGVKKRRRPYRMITDYTTIIVVLPILLICSSGISLYMSSFVQENIKNPIMFLSPMVLFLLDIAPWFITCLFFTGMYKMIPYEKVSLKLSFVSGLICGSLYHVLQFLFVSGQMYVTKYNAIYGSFSFIPLFMIWMYMTWLICITGVVLTYSAQNIFRFNYSAQCKKISNKYREELMLYILFIIVRRFEHELPPLSKNQFAKSYDLPIQLVNNIIDSLVDAGLLSEVTNQDDSFSYQPAINLSDMTLEDVVARYDRAGESNFILELRSNELLLEIDKMLDFDSPNQKLRLKEIVNQIKF